MDAAATQTLPSHKTAWAEVTDAPACDAWDAFVAGLPTGHMHHCTWWATPLRRYGVRTHLLVGPGRPPNGGALVRAVPLPLPGLCLLECFDGPVITPGHKVMPEVWLDALTALADRTRAVSFTLKRCGDSELHAGMCAALTHRRQAWNTRPAARTAVIPLAGRTAADVGAGFHTRTRRAIRKAQERGVRVMRLTTPAELRLAYDTWLATADRKGFEDVRPWPALEPVLTRCLRDDVGAVWGARLDDRIVAAIFVTYLGDTAHYVYGGFHVDAAASSPTHGLHQCALIEAIRRGQRSYDMGNLVDDGTPGRNGIDDFKLSFGAAVTQPLDTLIWERKPLLCRGIRWARRGGLVSFWKQRLLARAAQGRA